MEKYQLKDVFTPTSPAKITFIERSNDINNRLVRALDLPGNQVVIYGYSGSGKSTLLENILYRTYEKQINTNCMKGMTFEQIILDGFDQLEDFYVNEITNSKKNTIDAKAKADYLAIKTQLSMAFENASAEKHTRVLPPQLTPQNLGRLLGQSGYCWVLEDFHKIEGEEKEKLAQMMKVFVNLSVTYPDLKIIALGAVNTARQVVKSDKEMRRRITEIHVDLMSSDEIKQIISKGCAALNIEIDDGLQNDIANHSNGLASICHKICYLMCSAALINETVKEKISFTAEDLHNALCEYISDEEDTIRDAFDSALKIEKIEPTLRVLSAQNISGAHVDDLYQWSKEHLIKITTTKLKEDLENLEKEEFGSLVKLEENSQKYSFADPFYRGFSMAYFEQKDSTLQKKRMTEKDMLELFNSAFKILHTNFGSV